MFILFIPVILLGGRKLYCCDGEAEGGEDSGVQHRRPLAVHPPTLCAASSATMARMCTAMYGCLRSGTNAGDDAFVESGTNAGTNRGRWASYLGIVYAGDDAWASYLVSCAHEALEHASRHVGEVPSAIPHDASDLERRRARDVLDRLTGERATTVQVFGARLGWRCYLRVLCELARARGG